MPTILDKLGNGNASICLSTVRVMLCYRGLWVAVVVVARSIVVSVVDGLSWWLNYSITNKTLIIEINKDVIE